MPYMRLLRRLGRHPHVVDVNIDSKDNVCVTLGDGREFSTWTTSRRSAIRMALIRADAMTKGLAYEVTL